MISTIYTTNLTVPIRFNRTEEHDPNRGIIRLKLECVIRLKLESTEGTDFSEYTIESVSEVGITAPRDVVEQEFRLIEAEIAKKISNVERDD